MNFTREPIIETVITPREGCKLVLRNSKGGAQEDYFVDAIEVVSFGQSFFFRSLERPKSFLVPMSDYEVLEVKETRMVLKNAPSDRAIKIGGGRDAPPPPRPQHPPRESAEEAPLSPEMQQDRGGDKKRDRRRSRRRRGGGGSSDQPRHDTPAEQQAMAPEDEPEEAQGVERDEEIAPSFISKLFPPPPTLIKETLGRYKTTDEGLIVEEKITFKDEPFDYPIPPSEASEEEETKFED